MNRLDLFGRLGAIVAAPLLAPLAKLSQVGSPLNMSVETLSSEAITGIEEGSSYSLEISGLTETENAFVTKQAGILFKNELPLEKMTVEEVKAAARRVIEAGGHNHVYDRFEIKSLPSQTPVFQAIRYEGQFAKNWGTFEGGFIRSSKTP